jgi:hypothetical protein
MGTHTLTRQIIANVMGRPANVVSDSTWLVVKGSAGLEESTFTLSQSVASCMTN